MEETVTMHETQSTQNLNIYKKLSVEEILKIVKTFLLLQCHYIVMGGDSITRNASL